MNNGGGTIQYINDLLTVLYIEANRSVSIDDFDTFKKRYRDFINQKFCAAQLRLDMGKDPETVFNLLAIDLGCYVLKENKNESNYSDERRA